MNEMVHISTKRAIEILKARSEFVADINIDAKTAYKMAISALEKQIPKTVGETLGDYENIYYCDRCGRNLRYEHQKYCEDCGGKQGW